MPPNNQAVYKNDATIIQQAVPVSQVETSRLSDTPNHVCIICSQVFHNPVLLKQHEEQHFSRLFSPIPEIPKTEQISINFYVFSDSQSIGCGTKRKLESEKNTLGPTCHENETDVAKNDKGSKESRGAESRNVVGNSSSQIDNSSDNPTETNNLCQSYPDDRHIFNSSPYILSNDLQPIPQHHPFQCTDENNDVNDEELIEDTKLKCVCKSCFAEFENIFSFERHKCKQTNTKDISSIESHNDENQATTMSPTVSTSILTSNNSPVITSATLRPVTIRNTSPPTEVIRKGTSFQNIIPSSKPFQHLPSEYSNLSTCQVRPKNNPHINYQINQMRPVRHDIRMPVSYDNRIFNRSDQSTGRYASDVRNHTQNPQQPSQQLHLSYKKKAKLCDFIDLTMMDEEPGINSHKSNKPEAGKTLIKNTANTSKQIQSQKFPRKDQTFITDVIDLTSFDDETAKIDSDIHQPLPVKNPLQKTCQDFLKGKGIGCFKNRSGLYLIPFREKEIIQKSSCLKDKKNLRKKSPQALQQESSSHLKNLSCSVKSTDVISVNLSQENNPNFELSTTTDREDEGRKEKPQETQNSKDLRSESNGIDLVSNEDIEISDGEYQCGVCNAICENKFGLYIHEKQHETCIYCFKSFLDKTSYKKHRLEKHSIDRKWTCEVCREVFPHRIRLIKHMKNVHRDKLKRNQCQICFMTFDQEKSFRAHLNTHINIYDCELIFKSYDSNLLLRRHYRQAHLLKTRYPCTIPNCGKTFSLRHKMKDHVRKHYEKQCGREIECPKCKKIIKGTLTFKSHMKSVHSELKVCPICGVKKKQHHMTTHMQLAHLEDRYICEYCGRIFKSMTNLNLHVRTHTGEKTYKCEVCEKSFSRGDNLKSHMRMHTGEKPYKCHICGSSFSRKDNLNTHFKQH